MESNISIDAMIAQMITDARQLGYSESSIWCNMVPRWKAFSNYYSKRGISAYDPAITKEFVELQRDRLSRNEVSNSYFRIISSAGKRLNQYYLSGTVIMKMPSLGSPFRVSPQNEQLIADFITAKGYGSNTREDATWVVRRYLSYFESLGYSSLANVTKDQVREYILKTASAVKISTLHDILLYLKYFHRYLRDNHIAAPDCVELFSYRVCREMPVQGYVTDEELDAVLNVIDRTTEAGKRDYAIIMLAATTGIRACDVIRLKLTDIDWEKGEFKLIQQKTARAVYCPLLWEVGESMKDYILNARPKTGCPEVFLRTVAPKTAIATAAAVGFMFKSYQEKAGICRHPFDGKGFHGMRRRLAKKLLVADTSLTTIMQILGHNDPQTIRQYLSLNTDNLKECALDLRTIPVKREALL